MHIPITSAIHLLHETTQAVLASHSTQMPGYPYATAVPLVVDEGHQPLLLVSALAEHTKNLLADSRASLALAERGSANLQNSARMTLVGKFERCSPAPETVARYLRYQAEAEHYLQLDFMFFRINIERVRFIGGVGKMGWLEAAQWSQLPTFSGAVEAGLLADCQKLVAPGVRICGLDAYGIDFESAGHLERQRFESALSSNELRERLPDLLALLA